MQYLSDTFHFQFVSQFLLTCLPDLLLLVLVELLLRVCKYASLDVVYIVRLHVLVLGPDMINVEGRYIHAATA
jgi:hypothetical protein